MQPFYLFTAFDIPVRVSPFYLLILWMFGRGDLQSGMIWGVCITVSILVHEFGHALVARALGLGPEILLHGFGGQTARARAESRMDDALIVASGPAAALALGVLTVIVLLTVRVVAPEALESKAVVACFEALLYVNLGWSVFNLLPLWPLDGGHLFRLGAQRLLPNAATADRVTHITALCLIGALMLWMMTSQSLGTWTVIMLALLGWENYRALGGAVSSGTVHRTYGRGAAMLRDVRAALDAGNAREAARLCHVTRSSTELSPEQLAELWGLLGAATVQLGEHEEALSYLKRAPRGPSVDAATRAALEALGRQDELATVSAAQTRRKPRTARRRWLWAVVSFDLVCMAGAVVFYFGI